MISIIIFSFNRALQLEALLASINNFWERPAYKVTIIYNTSGEEYQRAYEILKKEYANFSFIKETNKDCYWQFSNYLSVFNLKKIIRYPNQRKQKSNFRCILIKTLEDCNADYTMFLTDDSAFIRKVSLEEKDLAFINENPQNNQISLRLGKSITKRPADIALKNGVLKWSFSEHINDKSWGYNFSVDGHIYSTALMRKILGRTIFNNPSTLEANVVYYARMHKLMNQGLTFESPFILSFPLNMVQTVADNESMGISVDVLNELCLDGKRLSYVIPDEIFEFQQYPEQVVLSKDSQREYLQLK